MFHLLGLGFGRPSQQRLCEQAVDTAHDDQRHPLDVAELEELERTVPINDGRHPQQLRDHSTKEDHEDPQGSDGEEGRPEIALSDPIDKVHLDEVDVGHVAQDDGEVAFALGDSAAKKARPELAQRVLEENVGAVRHCAATHEAERLGNSREEGEEE